MILPPHPFHLWRHSLGHYPFPVIPGPGAWCTFTVVKRSSVNLKSIISFSETCLLSLHFWHYEWWKLGEFLMDCFKAVYRSFKFTLSSWFWLILTENCTLTTEGTCYDTAYGYAICQFVSGNSHYFVNIILWIHGGNISSGNMYTARMRNIVCFRPRRLSAIRTGYNVINKEAGHFGLILSPNCWCYLFVH